MITLRGRPKYGIEIMEMIWEASEFSVPMHYGSLYPLLSKLKKRKFIVEAQNLSKEDDLRVRKGCRRKYYALTREGVMALDQAEQLRINLYKIQQV